MSFLAVIFCPVLLACFARLHRDSGGFTGILCGLAALPALLVALGVIPLASAHIPWLLLGASFGLDPVRSVFLLLTALLWFAAGCFAGGYFRDAERVTGLRMFFLFAMAGNFGLVVAEDVASFYTFFALMTFSSYGLVVHVRSEAAFRAGRIYLVMAIFGELLLVSAIYAVVQAAGTIRLDALAPALAEMEHRNLVFLLVFAGFGVKAGAVPLYFWLPLAHPVAPTPASAVLSGAMIKAGLLGWMHFAPVGLGGWPVWSGAVIALGLAAAFGAVVIGFVQTDPKTNLAYSSISQMGLMTVLLGIGLGGQVPREILFGALALYAWNHGMAKGALFLGTAVAGGAHGVARVWVLAGLAVAAASIAAAPLTGGAITKYALKEFAPEASGLWPSVLPWLIPLTSLASALLLTRFLCLAWAGMGKGEHRACLGMCAPWVVLIAVVCAGTLLVRAGYGLETPLPGLSAAGIFEGAWPVFAGCLAALAIGRTRFLSRDQPLIPPGDFIVVIEAVLRAMRRWWRRVVPKNPGRWAIDLERWADRIIAMEEAKAVVDKVEARIGAWNLVGVLFLGILIVLVLLLW